MKIGKIRIKTLIKALVVCYGSLDQNRNLTVDEIVQALHCSKGNAYNYRRFLRVLFPDGPFDETKPVGDEQKCLK